MNDFSRLYFLGIAGTAMGALARACQEIATLQPEFGIEHIGGSDNGVYSPMREFLDTNNIQYFDEFRKENIIAFAPTCVVVGNAISRGNCELEEVLDQRIPMITMPELVRNVLIHNHTSVVVAGTHGKTSTSSMIAWILAQSTVPTGFFIGAITGNFNSGCRPVPTSTDYTENNTTRVFVSEGDEYDSCFYDKRSKFLSYRPDIAIINNIEFDHADIFPSLEAIISSFNIFARLVPGNGLLLANADDTNVASMLSKALTTVETFGLTESATWQATGIIYSQNFTEFDVVYHGNTWGKIRTVFAGEFNVRNALAAIATAHRIGLSIDVIQRGFNTFRLPKRRLEEIATWHNALVIDDFAHHPTAILQTLKAVKQRYANRRIIACFEPRSNTTTRNFFQSELAECFADADVVIIGLVNRPERYPENERMNTQLLAEQLLSHGKRVFIVGQEHAQNKIWGEVVKEYLSSITQNNDVIILCSNGDFGGLRLLLQEQEHNSSPQSF